MALQIHINENVISIKIIQLYCISFHLENKFAVLLKIGSRNPNLVYFSQDTSEGTEGAQIKVVYSFLKV